MICFLWKLLILVALQKSMWAKQHLRLGAQLFLEQETQSAKALAGGVASLIKNVSDVKKGKKEV